MNITREILIYLIVISKFILNIGISKWIYLYELSKIKLFEKQHYANDFDQSRKKNYKMNQTAFKTRSWRSSRN